MVVGNVTQTRLKIDSAFFIGKGKINSILRQTNELNANIIIFNNDLSPVHVKNLQK